MWSGVVIVRLAIASLVYCCSSRWHVAGCCSRQTRIFASVVVLVILVGCGGVGGGGVVGVAGGASGICLRKVSAKGR